MFKTSEVRISMAGHIWGLQILYFVCLEEQRRYIENLCGLWKDIQKLET